MPPGRCSDITLCQSASDTPKTVVSKSPSRSLRSTRSMRTQSPEQSEPNQLQGHSSTLRPSSVALKVPLYRFCTAGSHVPGAHRRPSPVGAG